MTKRVKLTVAYDGTDFRGWAAQTGHRTVRSTLTDAVRRVSGEETEIIGASRTDSGAHAEGQVAHLDTQVPAANLVRALNDTLPLDVRVLRAEEVAPDFNARFCAHDRRYRYRILEQVNDPFRGRFAYAQRYRLDLAAMQNAAVILTGRHDFRAFTEELDPTIENTVRRLFSVAVSRSRDEIRIDIAGTAFLRGMMRRISGCLWEIGRGYRPVEDVPRLLSEDRDQLDWPVVLPARGLTLRKVTYGRFPKDHRDQQQKSNQAFDTASAPQGKENEPNDDD